MKNFIYIVFLSGLVLIAACKKGNEVAEEPKTPMSNEPVIVPAFSKDSAYAMVAKQVSFGPRVPGSPGHKAMQQWVVHKFKLWCQCAGAILQW